MEKVTKTDEVSELVARGKSLLAGGNYNVAVELFERALKLDSECFDAAFSLGSLLVKAGNNTQAESYLMRSVELAPENHMALGMLGVCKYNLQKFEEAVDCYSKVINIQPLNVQAYANLSITYLDMGLRKQAVSCARKVIEINPRFVAGYCLLGSALSSLGEYEQAYEQYNKALEIMPDYRTALSGKINTLIKLGRKAEAKLILEKVIEDNIVDESIVSSFLSLSVTPDEINKSKAVLSRVMTNNALTHKQKLILHFSAGEFYDRIGEYDKAFEHYRCGNDLVKRDYNRDEFEKYFDDIISVFTRDFLGATPRAAVQSDIEPVFVLGMPRSGTSLVERILGCHPDVYPAGELTSIYRISCDISSAVSSIKPFPGSVLDMDIDTINDFSRRHLDFLAKISNGEKLVIDKVPHNFLFIGLIEILFPAARIIHCIRDPVDTCLSNYFQYFSGPLSYPYKLENIVHHYKLYRKIMRHWKGVVSLPILEVHYENLVENQESEIRRMLDYLELPWNGSCMTFYKSPQVTRTASNDQVRSPLYKKSVGRWKNYEKHIAGMKSMLDHAMDGDKK